MVVVGSGDGLRRTKTSPDGTTTTFTWDRASGLPLLIAETIDAPGTSNDRTIRYVQGPTGVLADITEPPGSSETLRWYHQDQLGSTVALTDTTGQVIGTASYRPYGQPDHTTGHPGMGPGRLHPNCLSGSAVMTVISEFFLNEFNDYVASVLRRELSAGRHAEFTFNIFNVLLDPDAGLATVRDELDPDRSEVVGLDEFARMVEERSQE